MVFCDNKMTLRNFIDYTQEQLAPLYPPQECKAIAVRMLKELLAGYKGYEHMVEPATELDTFQLEEHLTQQQPGTEKYLLSCVERLATGEPLQYVMGHEWFCGHRFNVAPGVLIPRPETEELVQQIVRAAGAMSQGANSLAAGMQGAICKNVIGQGAIKVLDICTGSGCIALSVAAAVPGAQVYGCDISPVALEVSRGQRVCSERGEPVEVKFFDCDILSPKAQEVILSGCGEGCFDIIVSNPPYVCECEKELMHKNVLDHEPHLALFVPDTDPLRFYRRIGELSGSLLKKGGMLFFEINERFGNETVAMLEGLGFTDCKVLQDLFGKERMVLAKK